MNSLALAMSVAVLAAPGTGMELTSESWDAAVAGKTVFVKYLAPW
jgi:hypothetical protein